MWGGVGRGKTYLMDVFYEALPFEEKRRLHFHRFMQEVHREMRKRQGEKNPLLAIADDMARQFMVLCFDEFFVTDITDAMILAGLLDALFARGVTLVTTSNIVPDGLYRNGLQRARFLPAIDLLKTHTRVLNVDGGTDYRLRLLEQAEALESERAPRQRNVAAHQQLRRVEALQRKRVHRAVLLGRHAGRFQQGLESVS